MITGAFIVSCGRSGSTLLDRLIGGHPSALAVGELRHLPKNIALNSVCSCGEKLAACGFWRPVIDAAGKRLGADLWQDPYALDLGYIQAAVEIDRRRQTRAYAARRVIALRWAELALRAGLDLRRSRWLSDFRRKIENNMMLHQLLREQSGRQIVVDSTKGFRWSIGQYLLQPTQSRIVLLTRDGRGVMASMMRSGRSRQQAVGQWVEYYRRALPWIQRHVAPEHVFRVRYEDLTDDTDATLARLYEFLGLPPADSAAQAGRGAEPHIVNGNPMRHVALGQIRRDERWRTELGTDDLSYFVARAGALSGQLGYQPEERS